MTDSTQPARRDRRAPSCATSRDSRALDLELLAGSRRPRPPHHHPAHAEDRAGAVRLRRLPARRPRAGVRRERGPLPRDADADGARRAALRRVFSHDLPCVLDHRRLRRRRRSCRRSRPRAACRCCGRAAATPDAMARLSARPRHLPAPRAASIHGVLMDILGLGVLVIGESGIGKSECALDLVVRGHRLVADDAVELRCRAAVVRARQLPGADAPPHGDPRARPHQRPGPVRRRLDARRRSASSWSSSSNAGSTAASTIGSASTTSSTSCSASAIPMIRMPVAPGRNVAILVEVAARNQLLRVARPSRRAARSSTGLDTSDARRAASDRRASTCERRGAC